METHEKENIPLGCLMLNDKSYPVFEGLNTVGRHPEAVINIKNLNISKQHAVITVIDKNIHYISDFKSSNGTVLENTKLNPLKLYCLNHGASIKFGDVFCTYKRLDGDEPLEPNFNETQITQSFYFMDTQQVELPNSSDAVNFNELPTQAFTSRDVNINEMPTQVHTFDELDHESDDSIDFGTMQKASESQSFTKCMALSSSKKSLQHASNTNNAVLETNQGEIISQIQPVKKSTKNVINSDSDTDAGEEASELSRPPVETDEVLSHIRSVKKGVNHVIDSGSDTDAGADTSQGSSKQLGTAVLSQLHLVKKGTKNVIDSDSDTDAGEDTIEPSKALMETVEDLSQIHPVVKGVKKVINSESSKASSQNESLSQIHPVKKGTKNVINSDSDTEEYVPEDKRSKYDISSDSETDIELDNESVDKSEMDSLRLAVDECLDACNDESSINNDHGYCIPLDQAIAGPSTSGKDEILNDFGSNGNVEDNKTEPTLDKRPMEDSDNRNVNDVHREEPKTANTDQEKSKKIENVFDQPTQQLNLDFVSDKKLSEIIQDSDQDTEDLYVQSTQQLELNKESNQKSNSFKDDDIYFRPTQTLDILDNFSEAQSKSQVSAEEQQSSKEEKSTPPLVDETTLQPKDGDDICLPPTQALEYLHREDKIESNNVFATPKPPTLIEKENDPFLPPPTQALENLLGEDLPQKTSPSTKSRVTTNKSFTDIEDDDILPPTQALERLHKDEAPFNQVEDELAEIFASQSMMATQQLVSVLETSGNDDIIDDSMCDSEKISRKSLTIHLPKPISEESVKKILGEGIEGGDVKEKKSSVKTYSRNKDDAAGKSIGNNAKSEGNEDGNEDEITKDDSQKNKKVVKKQNSVEDLPKEGHKGKEENTNTIADKESIQNRSKRKQNLANIVVKQTEDENVIGKGKQQRKKEVNNEESVVSFEKRQNRSSNRRKQVDTEAADAEDTSQKEKEVENRRTKQRLNNEKKEGSKAKNEQRPEDLTDITEELNVKDIQQNEKAKQRLDNFEEKKVEKQRGRVNQKTEDVEVKKSNRSSKRITDSIAEVAEEGKNRSQSTYVDQQTKTRSKRKNDTVDPEEVSSKVKKKTTDSSVENTKIAKGDIKLTTSTPKKRTRETSLDLEEAFESKLPRVSEIKKTSATPRMSARKVKTDKDDHTESASTAEIKKATTRMSTRNAKGGKDDDTESVTSTSSNHSEMKKTTSRMSTRKTKGEKDDDTESVTSVSSNYSEVKKTTPRMTTRKAKEYKDYDTESVTSTSSNHSEVSKTTPRMSTRKGQKDGDTESGTSISCNHTEIKKTTSKMSTRTLKEEKDDDTESGTSFSSNQTAEEPQSAKRGRRLSANSRRLKKEEQEKSIRNKAPSRQKTETSKSTKLEESPQRSRRQLKPKVVFTMMDNPELESLIRQLGGSVVDTVDTCTVLVTENVKRSQKLLCAVGQSKPICSPQWLYACKKASSFLDPWDFILEDKEAEKKWNFSLRESLRRSGKKKLLEDYSFQLIVNNAADVLKGAIESCGGKCVRSLSKADTENLIIVSSENNRSKYNKIVKQNSNIKVIEAEAVFDGTLRQEIRFDHHLLT